MKKLLFLFFLLLVILLSSHSSSVFLMSSHVLKLETSNKMVERELEEEDATFEEAFVAHVFVSITWLIYK